MSERLYTKNVKRFYVRFVSMRGGWRVKSYAHKEDACRALAREYLMDEIFGVHEPTERCAGPDCVEIWNRPGMENIAAMRNPEDRKVKYAEALRNFGFDCALTYPNGTRCKCCAWDVSDELKAECGENEIPTYCRERWDNALIIKMYAVMADDN